MQELTVIFVGPQGCGKGTQVALFREYLEKHDPTRPVVHFEAGADLRAFGEEGGYTQGLVQASLRRGELQPMFILSYVMSRRFISAIRGNEHLLVDGFPRSMEQLELFDSAVKFYKRNMPTLVYLEISDEEAVRRLLKRGRNDDSEESIRKRLLWTKEEVMPAMAWFKAHDEYRFIEIDGERPIEEIHRDILEKLGFQG